MNRTVQIIGAITIIFLSILQVSHILNFSVMWLGIGGFALVAFSSYMQRKQRQSNRG